LAVKDERKRTENDDNESLPKKKGDASRKVESDERLAAAREMTRRVKSSESIGERETVRDSTGKESSDPAEVLSYNGSDTITEDDFSLGLLDETNRTIIGSLQENPEISQTALAEKVGLSQSSVAIRLSRLVSSGLIKDPISVDYRRLGLTMARIDVSARESRLVFDWARNCPLCVNGSSVLDQINLTLYFVTEDLETLSCIIDRHLMKIDGVTKSDCQLITSWAWEDSLHVHLDLGVRRTETPPCGIAPFCPKCPQNPDYQGKVWPPISAQSPSFEE